LFFYGPWLYYSNIYAHFCRQTCLVSYEIKKISQFWTLLSVNCTRFGESMKIAPVWDEVSLGCDFSRKVVLRRGNTAPCAKYISMTMTSAKGQWIVGRYIYKIKSVSFILLKTNLIFVLFSYPMPFYYYFQFKTVIRFNVKIKTISSSVFNMKQN